MMGVSVLGKTILYADKRFLPNNIERYLKANQQSSDKAGELENEPCLKRQNKAPVK